MPCDFSVVFLTYLPIKGTTFKRVKLHKNFGDLSEPVENKFCVLVCNFADPFKAFQKDV
jgi:hypothetical protein